MASTSESVIVLQNNLRTGEAEWVVAGKGEEEDDTQGLIAASSYLDMLTDHRRNRAYRVALERTLATIPPPLSTRSPRVLDIGTGTGVLAILAVQVLRKQQQQQAQSLPVVACELFPSMARVARKVVAANGFGGEVAVIDKRSDELVVGEQANDRESMRKREKEGAPGLPDMADKVDVVVTEIFDSALLGEGLLPSMRHAAQHLIKEGGCVIPARAIVWVQLVQCPSMQQWTGPVSSHSSLPAISSSSIPTNASASTDTGSASSLTKRRSHEDSAAHPPCTQRVLTALEQLNAVALTSELQGQGASAACMVTTRCDTGGSDCEGSMGGWSSVTEGSGEEQGGPHCCWQDIHELHVDVVQAQSQLLPLSAPVQVLDFKLANPPLWDTVKHGIKVPVTQSGAAHGFVLWWQLDMLPEHVPQSTGPLLLSTAPAWIGSDPGQGGDGGPLQGVVQEWRGHWAQCWSSLGAASGMQVCEGQEVDLSAKHDDLGIQLALTPSLTSIPAPPTSTQSPPTSAPPTAPHNPTSGNGPSGASGTAPEALQAEGQQVLPPLRAWLPPSAMQQLNGMGNRWGPFEACLHTRMQECLLAASNATRNGAVSPGQAQTAGLEIVCLGSQISPDQLMPPLLALACAQDLCARIPVDCKITALADHGAARKWIAATAQKLGAAAPTQQQLPADTDRVSLTVLPESSYMKRARHQTRLAEQSQSLEVEEQCGLEQGQEVLVIADPSYHQGKGTAPCTHLLQFWSDLDVVRRYEAAQGRHVTCFPARAVLRAVAVSIPHIARTRQRLAQVEGMDLSAANAVLGGDGLLELSLGVPWQCGGEYKEVSARADLLSLDFDQDPYSGNEKGSTELVVHRDLASDLHAVVVWVDFDLQGGSDQSGKPQMVIDNGPNSNAYSATQTVLLLPQAGHPRPSKQEEAAFATVRVSACLEDHGMSLSAHCI